MRHDRFVSSRRSAAAFTMVEIAISLGVIAFALVAIIGILPTGLQTQKDNREETIVVEDARVLIEAIKSGGRDVMSDIGAFVVRIDGQPSTGIETTNLIQLLSDSTVPFHTTVLSAFSGALATRGSEFGFQYQLTSTVTNAWEFRNTPLSNQVHEIRLNFVWPVRPDGVVVGQFNRYVARALISGRETNGYLYAQHFLQPTPMVQTNIP
jgi:type II secretory pathway pseudopilin PulG